MEAVRCSAPAVVIMDVSPFMALTWFEGTLCVVRALARAGVWRGRRRRGKGWGGCFFRAPVFVWKMTRLYFAYCSRARYCSSIPDTAMAYQMLL